MDINGKDAAMIERLMKSGVWEMPEGIVSALPSAMSAIIFTKTTGEKPAYLYNTRQRTAAARILVQMMGQNQAANPVPQELNVNVAPDLTQALDNLKGLPREELQKLAAAHDLLAKIAQPAPPAA